MNKKNSLDCYVVLVVLDFLVRNIIINILDLKSYEIKMNL